ncbi:hypothetical protein OROMI_013522 [Orobanche minor]
MEPKIYLLVAITPYTKNWTAKVSVLNKIEPRTSSQPASIRFQKMLFADKMGTAAIIIDGHTSRTVTAKGKQNTLHEYAAVDELINPFIITFWNDAAPDDVYNLLDRAKDKHIIAALNFNVTDYHNIYLSSTSASVVLMNSKIKRVQDLQQWEVYFIHKKEIDDIRQQGDVFKKAQSNFSIDSETFTSVQTFLTVEQQDRSIMCVRGKLLSTNQNFIYQCCTKCHRLTTAEYGCLFECHSCHEIKNAIPRYRFSLLIYDQIGEMEVTVFGNEGEKSCRCRPPIFLINIARLLTIDSINSNLHQMQLKMKVQSRVFKKQDGTRTLSHTMQSLECIQLPSSTISADEIPAASSIVMVLLIFSFEAYSLIPYYILHPQIPEMLKSHDCHSQTQDPSYHQLKTILALTYTTPRPPVAEH